jgi:molybdenum-dependent DNA-binding transcriptional regulator ModE
LNEIIKSEEIQQDFKDPITLITNKKQIKFLQEIILTGGSIRKAAERAGISTSSHYDWLSKQDSYRKAFEQAFEKSTKILEAEAIRRATGYQKPLVYKGEVTGYVQEHSDNLLMFLLKKRDPSYRDNHTQQVGIWGTGQDGVNVIFNIPRPPKIDKKEIPTEESG